MGCVYRPQSRYRRRSVMRRWTTPLLLASALYGLPCGVAAFVLTSPHLASAQDAPPAQATEHPMDDPRVASVRPRLLAAAARAEAEGLPPAWIESKVREGLAKHVAAERIAAAVEQLAGRMHDAAAIARAMPMSGRTAVARAVLDALAVGARAEGLGQLVREVARGNRSAATDAHRALSAVAELGERGFDAELATRASIAAWRNGGRDGLRSLVELARRIPRSEARARGDELAREAAAPHANAGRENGHDSADRPTVERGGPPRDDSFTQGASRGRGRALGHTAD